MSKIILLTRGHEAIVDDIDLCYLVKWDWHSHSSNGKYYAARCYKIKGKTYIKYMHREIMEVLRNIIIPVDKEVDHIDQDTFNNQRHNLRIVSQSINSLNSKLHSRNTSGFRGVRYENKRNNYSSRININGQSIWFGSFPTIELAIQARKEAEFKYLGI